MTLKHCFLRHVVIICCSELNHTGSTGVFIALTICVLTPRRPVWPQLSSPSSAQLWDPSAPSSICVLVLAPELYGCNPCRPLRTISVWHGSASTAEHLPAAASWHGASVGTSCAVAIKTPTAQYSKHSSEMGCSKLQTGHFFLMFHFASHLLHFWNKFFGHEFGTIMYCNCCCLLKCLIVCDFFVNSYKNSTS